MTVRVLVSVTIAASASTVWRAIEAVETHVDWMADAEAIHITSPQRVGVGTVFRCRTKIGPVRLTDVMCITAWREGREMGVAHRGVISGRGTFRLTPLAAGVTRFGWEEQLTVPWWCGGDLTGWLATPILDRVWQGNLWRLKRQVERAKPLP